MADFINYDAFSDYFNHTYSIDEDPACMTNPYVFACDLNQNGTIEIEDFAYVIDYDACTLEYIDQTYGQA